MLVQSYTYFGMLAICKQHLSIILCSNASGALLQCGVLISLCMLSCSA